MHGERVAVSAAAIRAQRGDKGVNDITIYNVHIEMAVDAGIIVGENGAAVSVAVEGGQWNNLNGYGVKIVSAAYVSIENLNMFRGAAPFTMFSVAGSSTRNLWINNTHSSISVAESSGSVVLEVDPSVTLSDAIVMGPTNEWQNYETEIDSLGRVKRVWGNTVASSSRSGTGDFNANGLHGVVVLTASSTPVISNITDGVRGQRLTFIPDNAVKLDCLSGNIASPATSSDFWMAANQATSLVYDGTEWYIEVEQSRSRANFSTTGSTTLDAAGKRMVRCNASSAQTITNIDIAILGDICKEVREVAIHCGLNRSQIRALPRLRETSKSWCRKCLTINVRYEILEKCRD